MKRNYITSNTVLAKSQTQNRCDVFNTSSISLNFGSRVISFWVISLMLSVLTFNVYATDKVCKDEYVDLDINCATETIERILYADETGTLESSSQLEYTITHMGFSFSGLWDALTNWFSKSEKPDNQIVLAPDCPPTSVISPYIGGRIFRDVDHNGLYDVTIDVPVPNVLVSVYSDTGLVGTTTSSADGDYLFQSASMTVGTEYRVEFTGYPGYLQTATVAPGTYTSVQFFTPNVCNIDFGLVDPYEYVGPAPSLVLPCYLEGDNVGNAGDALVSIDFDNPSTISHESQGLQIGTTFGVAYSRQSELVFVSAFMKRFAGFASGTTGSIYAVNDPTDGNYSGSLFVDLNTLFGSNVAGDNVHVFPAVGDIFDDAAFNAATRSSLGDMDATSDGDTLWVVNLYDRSLYGIPLGNDPTNPVAPANSSEVHVVPMVGNLPGIPAGVSDNEIRPFGLKYNRGQLYVGVVTNGEDSDVSTMFGLAYRFDSSTGNFTKVLEFPLNYDRGCALGFIVSPYNECNGGFLANWNPWINDTILPVPVSVPGYATSWDQAHPQPIFADIEFDADNNMLVGLRDRFGDQMGYNSFGPYNQPMYGPDTTVLGAFANFNDAFGDMLRATPNGTGWSINITDFTDPTKSGPSTTPTNTEPFFGEDYYAGSDNTNHEEIIMGSMAVIPGTNIVAVTSVDPDGEPFSNGVRWYNTETGALVNGFTMLTPSINPLVGKANGFGDLELVSSPPPIEIGNRLWKDDDLNGIQDPGEPGINGVLVELYLETSPGIFTKVAETVTGTSGTQGEGAYLFSNSGAVGQIWLSGYTEIVPFSNYEVRLNLTNVQTVETDITNFTNSNQNSDISNNANTDLNDSDLVDNNGTAVISYTTGDNGFHNHTLDFGVVNCITPTVTAYALSASCTDGIPNDDAYLQISAASVATHYNFNAGSTYTGGGLASATPFNPATDLPLQLGALIPNPAADTDYTIRVFNGEDACFNDFVVTLQTQIDCSANCDCRDYLYLNDTGVNYVEKFQLNSDGSMTEIGNAANGNPWMDANGIVDGPHGIAADLNGYIYIGERDSNTNESNIQRFNCAGQKVDGNFSTPGIDNFTDDGFGYSHFSIDNLLYVSPVVLSGGGETPSGEIRIYDICNGTQLGCQPTPNLWALVEGPGDGYWYGTTYAGIMRGLIDPSQFTDGNGGCGTSELWMTRADLGVTQNDEFIQGITFDADGNLYGVISAGSGYAPPSRLFRMDANTGTITTSITDNAVDNDTNDNLNWGGARGLVWSANTNYLYASSVDDCIAVFDTDLNYQPTLSNHTKGVFPKQTGIITECCPAINRQIIDKTYCIADTSIALSLNDIYDCEGIVCEGGEWQMMDIQGAIEYETCDQTVRLSNTGGCATFVKSSDGVGNNLQCGAFEITMNVEFIYNAPAILSDTLVCLNDTFTLTPTIDPLVSDITYQWQSSSVSCEGTFTDIAGATESTYTTTAVADTLYYRLLTTVTGGCSSGNCTEISNCATVMAENCCPVPNCFGITIQQN